MKLNRDQRRRAGAHVDLLDLCAVAYGTTIDVLLGRSQVDKVLMARRLAVLLLSRQKLSSKKIGRILDRHHTTVLNALARASELDAADPVFRGIADRLSTHFELRPRVRRDVRPFVRRMMAPRTTGAAA